MKKLTAIILVLVMAFSLMSCGEKDTDAKKDKVDEKPGKVEDLSKSSTQETPKPEELLKVIQNPDGFQKGYRNFNAKLLAECYQGETMMVSPFSLYAALGMLGNGASGETLKEMEQLFGCNVEEASKAVLYLMLRSEEADVIRIADSIWIEDDTPVNDAFLSRCGLYYRSSVMRAHLSADSTIQKINDWVNEHTKGRIEKILDKIDDDAVMVLLNAITFDGKWEETFNSGSTNDQGEFYTANGEKKTMEMMFGGADRYFEDSDMIGMEKDYRDGYCFRAYLPKEGKTVRDIIGKLAESQNLPYQGASEINLLMPKFKGETTLPLEQTLQTMGMKAAFSPSSSDFSEMSTLPGIYVSKVLQKTYIKVDEEGTEAAAVTAIVANTESFDPNRIVRNVYLDHPFIYEIVDTESGITLFTGVFEG